MGHLAAHASRSTAAALRDRENTVSQISFVLLAVCRNGARPQRPGKRAPCGAHHRRARRAAMKPGLRDRENAEPARQRPAGGGAAMEPGLRDRENLNIYGAVVTAAP